MSSKMSTDTKGAWILTAIAVSEGTWVLFSWIHNGGRFLRYLGFAPGRAGTIGAWLLALLLSAVFVTLSLRLPSVRANLFAFTKLKLLGFAVAVSAGILEEVIFRKWLMDSVARSGAGAALQILVSGIAFGAAHGVWGLMGRSLRAAGAATLATGILGAALASVYVVSGRSLAPCIAAHFLINALIEPGLVLAVIRGEMGKRTSVQPPFAAVD
jgi:membrane protease YdiL (CAAX protease family)